MEEHKLIVVNTYDQPIETYVKVGIEVDSRGQKKSSIEVRINRKLDKEHLGITYTTVIQDLQFARSEIKKQLTEIMEA